MQAVRARTGAWQQVTSDIAAAQAANLLLQEPARRRVLAEAAQVSLVAVLNALQPMLATLTPVMSVIIMHEVLRALMRSHCR